MSIEWYYNRDGETFGPYSSSQIKELALSGQLRPSDLLAKAGELWREARHVKDLFSTDQRSSHGSAERVATTAAHSFPQIDDETREKMVALVDGCLSVMKEMADQMEKTHRGMISSYNEYVKTGQLKSIKWRASKPSARGIYKARLFGALFIPTGISSFSITSTADEWAAEFIQLASTIALAANAPPLLNEREAKSFSHRYIQLVMTAIDDAIEAGPFFPGSDRPEHRALAEHLHDALSESIGIESYGTDVWQRFSVTIQMNAAMSLNHLFRFLAAAEDPI